MAEESDLQYKDISELRKELEAMKGRKDISARDLYQSVQKMSQTMSDMLEVFGAAAEQMRQEEKEYGTDSKKNDLILSKLDKVIEQNKTIAEGMVSVVEMVKEKLVMPAKEREEPMFRPMPEPKPFEPRPFMKPQQDWQPRPEFKPRQQPSMQQMSQQMPQPSFNPTSFTPPLNPPSFGQAPNPPLNPPNLNPPDFGMPSLQPTPEPDLDFPETDLGLEEEPKKKGLFGMFKK